MDLALAVRRMLQKERMIRFGDTVVCAVSGGPDSMALLHVLWRLSEELRLTVVAAHVNHGFRGAESDHEAVTVERFAESLGLRYESMKADVPDYVRRNRLNAQAGAREVRYRFLLATAVRCGANSIALGHHLDDQAETILMNLLNGASLQGLSGMPPKRREKNMQLIRPFLRIPKKEILAYIGEQGIPYCLDSSNQSRKYQRNRLRLDVMPGLLAFNPSLPQALGRMSDILRDEEAYMERQTEESADAVLERGDGYCKASRARFRAEPVALQRRLIKLILNYLSGDSRFPDHDKIESIRSAIDRAAPPSLSLDIGAGIRFERTYDRIEWKRVRPGTTGRGESLAYVYTIEQDDDRLALPEAGGILEVEFSPCDSSDALPNRQEEALFDADLLPFPLTVRSRRNGDRMDPIGVNGSKKVKDLFIDLKIEPERRNRLPMIVDGNDRIVWIPGIRRSRIALVSDTTSRVVRLRFVPYGS